jgi:hypothetical protein
MGEENNICRLVTSHESFALSKRLDESRVN